MGFKLSAEVRGPARHQMGRKAETRSNGKESHKVLALRLKWSKKPTSVFLTQGIPLLLRGGWEKKKTQNGDIGFLESLISDIAPTHREQGC